MHEAAHHFLATLAIVLCAAAVTTVVFQRLKQPVVLGYLLAGMLIGPHTSVPLEADPTIVHTLSELGVILLMFSLGIEFSFQKLREVGPTAGVIGVMQCSIMVWLGYIVGQALGWTWLESIYAGAVIAISSTTIIIKAFQEQRIRDKFTELVFGILIVEDLIAILLLTVLTTLSAGGDLEAAGLATAAGELAAFLTVLVVVGMLIVPRLMRYVVALDRPETTVVTSVGLAFGCAYLALYFGYSVALGAFIAGSLVAESGVEIKVEHLVQPVRDLFAALFFVSVGMLIDPTLIATHWMAVAVFVMVVVAGKVLSVTFGAFLTGMNVQTAVKTGMSLAQIGEFSFIIAGVGLTTGATGDFLYPIAVAVSAITTMLTPWLIRSAEPAAKYADRKLPRRLQTFVALYGSWLEDVYSGPQHQPERSPIRRWLIWLAADAIAVTSIIITASINEAWISDFLQQQFRLSDQLARFSVVLAGGIVSAPFWVGMIRVARALGQELAGRALPPPTEAGKLDTAYAPRRLLVVTLQLGIVLLVGAPLLAVTQPFLQAWQSVAVFALLIVLLAFNLWRRAASLQGHTRAAAQALVESLAQRMRETSASASDRTRGQFEAMFAGLGSPVPVQISPHSSVVGKSLAELNLRGLTGATILAIKRGETTLLVPAGKEVLSAGDILALAGAQDATQAAERLLAE